MSYGRFLGFDGWHVAGTLDVDEVLFGSAVPHRAMHEFTDIGFCGTSRRMGRSLRAGNGVCVSYDPSAPRRWSTRPVRASSP